MHVFFNEWGTQCPNGHLVCLTCLPKLGDTCPCCRTSGYDRSRAVEKILESVKKKCKNAEFGCTKTMNYTENHDDHEMRCYYAPCDCPFSGCDFFGSWQQLGKHVDDIHDDDVERFDFGQEFKISRPADEECAVLRELETNTLFLLYNRYERLGNVVSVCHIAPSCFEDQYLYKIKARSGDRVVEFQTSSRSIEKRIDNPPSNGYLVIPTCFTGCDGRINLYISIRAKSEWLE